MQINFSEDEPFVVKNSIGIMLFIAIAGAAMFFSAVSNDDGTPLFAKTITIGLVPMVIGIIGIIINKPMIQVDQTGLYSSGKLVTDWPHFAHACFKEMPVAGSYSDNFVLIVEYAKDGIPGYFKSTMKLSDTQNKSEEAVVAAIYFFYNSYRSKNSSAEILPARGNAESSARILEK